jgi:hypothetical protein
LTEWLVFLEILSTPKGPVADFTIRSGMPFIPGVIKDFSVIWPGDNQYADYKISVGEATLLIPTVFFNQTGCPVLLKPSVNM